MKCGNCGSERVVAEGTTDASRRYHIGKCGACGRRGPMAERPIVKERVQPKYQAIPEPAFPGANFDATLTKIR